MEIVIIHGTENRLTTVEQFTSRINQGATIAMCLNWQFSERCFISGLQMTGSDNIYTNACASKEESEICTAELTLDIHWFGKRLVSPTNHAFCSIDGWRLVLREMDVGTYDEKHTNQKVENKHSIAISVWTQKDLWTEEWIRGMVWMHIIVDGNTDQFKYVWIFGDLVHP